MADGFTAYINGTTFDAINAMAFNFVVDTPSISGSGSKTYSYPGFTISAAILGGRSTAGATQINYNVSVSGQTVSWSGVDVTSKLIVTATATSIANYAGFVLNDYSKNPPVFKIAPTFTPFNLAQVIDLTPSAGQVLQTNIPASQPFVAFHRSLTSSGFNHVWWTETTQNGFWALRFRPAFGSAMTATRIYIFSKLMLNVPSGGFFMYDNGSIVWHNNCLPLQMQVGAVTGSTVPLATTSGVSVVISYPADPGYPNVGQTMYNCYSGGVNSSGTYDGSGADLYASVSYSTPSAVPPSYSCGPPGIIQTNIYDAYYKLALGV
ncbi:hypothetical protein PUG42_06060 [Erwiniaceae bacterium L1_54_3]|nr:hypothetical protein [Erwiniaceae bacterium L1_54_3]